MVDKTYQIEFSVCSQVSTRIIFAFDEIEAVSNLEEDEREHWSESDFQSFEIKNISEIEE